MGHCWSDLASAKQAVGSTSVPGSDRGVLEAVGALPGSRGLSTHVELSLSASKLRNKDLLSKSDPMLVGYSRQKNGPLTEIGRTEVALNTLEPKWVTTFSIVYNFEEVQELRFMIYDVDTKLKNLPTKSLKLEEQDFLGQTDILLPEIVRASNLSITKSLTGASSRGSGELTVRAEEIQNSKFLVQIRAHCSKLKSLDKFSKSDPFLRISRVSEYGSLPVYKTEVKSNNLNPQWKPIKITLQQLCNGDMVRPLSIECFDFNSNGDDVLIGKTQTSASELQMMSETKEAKELCKERKSQQRTVQVTGKLHIDEFTVTPYHTFLDYVMGGCEIGFMVAIDFTASNGFPQSPESLHYIDPSGRPNAYQTAIHAIGDVIQYYDTDKRFSTWGFGGRPTHGTVSHCFALNGNEYDSEVVGVEGILMAYAKAIRNVQLAGPTLFSPVINMAASIASNHISQERQKYSVLLIVTDGVISDMSTTTDSLIAASNLPLSVLIVGVGEADYTDMETLDADKKKLTSSTGQVAVRDIVQFVPMRAVARSNLAQILLAELPVQLLDCMKLRCIVPKKPAQGAPQQTPPFVL